MEEKEGPSAKLDGQLFYEMFKTSPIGIALEDLQGRPLFANPALCSMLGFSEEEMRSKHRVDFSPSEDAKKDWALFEQLRTGLIDHYQIEKRFFRRDGSLFWGRLHISLLNHRPSPVVVALVDDITEKKMTQETLELAAKQMMAVTRCSRDLRYLWANQGGAELLQRPLDQIVGHSILEVLGNEAFESLRHHFERVLAGENVAYEEEVNYRSVGRRWISAAYTPTLNASGVVDGWVAVIADVTDRERAEDSARQSEAHLAAEAEALRRVNDLSGRLWRISDMQEGLAEMLVAVRSLLGTDKANIQLLDAQRGVLTIAAHYGFEQPFLEFFRQVSIEHPSACGRALAAGQRVVIEDTETDAAYAPLRSIARASGYRSVISTPLIGSGGSVLGILSTHSKSVYRPSEEALRRFDLYTRQAAGFIQRCQIEEALKKSEEMFSKAFRQTPLMLTVTSAKDGRFVEVNETKERISGWRRDELIGRTSVEMGIWVDPAQRVELIRRLSAEGTVRNLEVNFRTKYADVRVVLLSAELIEINGERCVLAVSEDITDLKRAEATLRESEERFRLVANTAPVMICMADVDMLCTYFNQRWLEFTGRSLQEELGKGWTEKVHPEELGRYLATCTQAFDRREPFQMEYRLRRHDGEYRWIFHQGVPRFNADGSLAGYIGSGIDVTER